MMLRSATIAVTAFLLTLTLAAQRPQGHRHPDMGNVPAVFLKAVRNANTLRYSGERVVEFQRGPNRKVHIEYVMRDGQNSRVTFPDDSDFAGQIIVENSQERLHYFPKRNEIEVLPTKREDAFIRLKIWVGHKNQTRLSSARGEPVAGRATEVGIVADQNGNVVQRLWVDSQTGLVLKRELLDAGGARMGAYEFRQVDYNPVIHPGDFTIVHRGAVRVTLADRVTRVAREHKMAVVMLPPNSGFTLDSVNFRQVAGKEVMHESYTASRGRLSLFQVAGVADLSGFQRRGEHELQFYGWVMNGRSFALVGNSSLADLRRLARTLGDPGTAL